MAINFSKVLGMADEFYNGAVKGAKKANYTMNKVATKNNMAKNLNVANTVSKSKSMAKNNSKVKINRQQNIPKRPVNRPTAAMKAGD